jgi:glutathione synthase/RimK-type ligase-like ATP-grasp enzyme
MWPRTAAGSRHVSTLCLVVESRKDWAPFLPSENVITFNDYLAMDKLTLAGREDGRSVRVINLCPQSRYLSKGYYCSLLAEARGHKVIPSVGTLNDLRSRALYSLALPDFHKQAEAVAQSLPELVETGEDGAGQMNIKVYFGESPHEELQALARRLFERFPCPILSIELKRRKGLWSINRIKPMTPMKLSDVEQTAFANALDHFSRRIWRSPKARRRYRFDLAMLIDPREELPPSNASALKQFIRAGRELQINVELIGKKDYLRLTEYDGLFIRETTGIDHHTYRFAKKAESEGMVVIDDPTSILRCTNKIYLADLFRAHKVPAPKTLILLRDQPGIEALVQAELGFPLVLKIPDGAFSRGVVRVESAEQFATEAERLFADSALLLAQEYLYTDFDWRIGILNGKPIYACRYYMVKRHWQIYKHNAGGSQSGGFDTMPTYEVPRVVLDAAAKAAQLIGDGLYGVDVKQKDNRAVVIEVNDNPSIDRGVEDKFLGDELYRIVMQEFLRRFELQRARGWS